MLISSVVRVCAAALLCGSAAALKAVSASSRSSRSSLRMRAEGGVVSRRGLMAAGVAATAVFAPQSAQKASADEITADVVPKRRESASVASLPSWTLLIPLLELREGLANMATGDAGRTRELLEKLTKGFVVSAKNFYLGVGTKYASGIKYDDIDRDLSRRDADARVSAILVCGASIDAAKKHAFSDDAFAAADARDDLKRAVAAMDDFLERCPKADRERASAATRHFQAADADLDGFISDSEFASLDYTEQLASTWGVWGTTIFSDLRPIPFPKLKLNDLPDVPKELRGLVALSNF